VLRVTQYFAMSLKVIENGTVRKLGYGFLMFTFHNNYGFDQGRSHQVRFGGDEINRRVSAEKFFCTSPPISAFWGGPNDLSLYRPKDV